MVVYILVGYIFGWLYFWFVIFGWFYFWLVIFLIAYNFGWFYFCAKTFIYLSVIILEGICVRCIFISFIFIYLFPSGDHIVLLFTVSSELGTLVLWISRSILDLEINAWSWSFVYRQIDLIFMSCKVIIPCRDNWKWRD